MAQRVYLIEQDPELRNALAFSLDLEGFAVQAAGTITPVELARAASGDCLVIAHEPNGANVFEALSGMASEDGPLPTIVLATNPTASFRAQLAKTGALLVEKPLLGDALSEALRSLIPSQGTAQPRPMPH